AKALLIVLVHFCQLRREWAFANVQITAPNVIINGDIINPVTAKEIEQPLGVLFREHLSVGLVAVGSPISHRPRKIWPPVKYSATIQENWVMHKPLGKENVGGLRALEQPV